ncbi:VWA domain-containing protein [Candidatus Uhrbacteria bacterium]|nr:VWA domain-containing protein [Candidatus Uhrbacteria bacterium]
MFFSKQHLLDVRVVRGRSTINIADVIEGQILVELRPSAVTQNHFLPIIELRLVIDCSGSMRQKTNSDQESKLDLVKKAILSLLSKLEPRDYLCLSIFSTTGKLLVPLTILHASGKELIRRQVCALEPMEETDISSGLELVMDPTIPKHLTRVILFTDGRSSRPSTDHPRLVRLADQARERNLPLSIYGTGADYNWSLLQQLAVRAGGGSFCKHVMNVATLEGHLLGELANLRGTAIERLLIRGTCAQNVSLIGVTRMMPEMHSLGLSPQATVFEDFSGALDIYRGQQYMLEFRVKDPKIGNQTVLNLEFSGFVCENGRPFEDTLALSVDVAQHESASPNPEIVKMLTMMSAVKQAETGQYRRAGELYRRAGDMETARMMDSLSLANVDEELRRSSSTMVNSSISKSYTRERK